MSNVINMFERAKKVDNKKEEQDTWQNNIQKNKEKERRLRYERAKANKAIARQLRR